MSYSQTFLAYLANLFGGVEHFAAVLIALLSFAVSLLALMWNIVRDLILEKPRLALTVSIGGLSQNPMNLNRKTFISIDADYKINNPILSFTMVNIGRKPIVIEQISARHKFWPRYKKKVQRKHVVFSTRELPKMLEPYDTHTEVMKIDDIKDVLRNGYYSSFSVKDTKGHKWYVSRKNMHRVKKQARKL